MERYDAIVVGGGPAGATCAGRLVAASLRTLVVDRARFPRVKLCAGWITPPVVRTVGLDLAAYARRHTLEPIHGFRLWRLGGLREHAVAFDEPVSYGIVRSELDTFLLRRSGAEVVEGVAVETIRRGADGVVVNERWTAPVVVGAGGHGCPVARHLGVVLRREKTIATLELEVELDASARAAVGIDPALPEIAFFDDIRGYGWAFVKGRFLNLGVGRTTPRGLRRFLRAFLERLDEKGRLARAAWPPEGAFRGHAYKLHYATPRPFVADRILLVGDAAGLAYNFSGEGIRPAVESGLWAAETILAAEGDYRRERLAPYGERLLRAYGRPLEGWRARWVERLPPLWFGLAGRVLLGSAALARRIVIERMFLHRHEEGASG